MAKPRYIQLYDNTNTPLTSAGPTYVDYRDKTGAIRGTPANPVHVGSGLYVYTPSDADEQVGTIALIDGGATAFPRYHCAVIHRPDNSNQFWAFHLENPNGTLWAGVAPVIGAYRNSAGADVAPHPSVVPVSGTYLFCSTPSLSDITNGVGLWVSYPAGASSVGYSGFTSGVGTAVSSAFTILSATPNARYLDITFTDSIAPLFMAAAVVSNWVINAPASLIQIYATNVMILSPTVIRLYHTKPHNGDLYVLTLPLTGLKSLANVSYNDSPTISFTAVAPGPTLSVANFVDIRQTRVIFSEDVLEPESIDPSNYSLSPIVPIYGVVKESASQYLLKTAPQVTGTNYTVTAINIKDRSFNTV